MITTRRAAGTNRASKVARLEADNAQLRRLATELEAHVNELRVAAGMKRSPSAVDPAHRLHVVNGGEGRARGP